MSATDHTMAETEAVWGALLHEEESSEEGMRYKYSGGGEVWTTKNDCGAL